MWSTAFQERCLSLSCQCTGKYNSSVSTSFAIHTILVYKISGSPGILTPKIAGGLPDFLTCFTPVCTSIYGMDAHRFWQTPRFVDMEIRQMSMFLPLIYTLYSNSVSSSYWWRLLAQPVYYFPKNLKSQFEMSGLWRQAHTFLSKMTLFCNFGLNWGNRFTLDATLSISGVGLESLCGKQHTMYNCV